MNTLTVSARGQVTFRKEVLQHLRINPGEKIELHLLPDGRVELRACEFFNFRNGRGTSQTR